MLWILCARNYLESYAVTQLQRNKLYRNHYEVIAHIVYGLTSEYCGLIFVAITVRFNEQMDFKNRR